MQSAQGTAEKERIDALNALEILRSGRAPEYDALVDTLAALFDCPIALISLVGEDEQWFKARCGLEVEAAPRDTSFCQHTILTDALFVVPDALKDGRFKNNPLVTGDPHIRFYAGCPLSLDGRNRIGTLCVADRRPRNPDKAQLDHLRRLATVVEGLFKSHQAQVETRSALRQAEKDHQLAVQEGELLEEIANVFGVGGWEIDVATNTLTWTDKAREIHEVGADFSANADLAQSFYAADCRAVIADAMRKGIEDGADWDLELPFVTAKGRSIWVRSAGRPIVENGRTVRLVGAIRDITGRKLAEQSVLHSEAVHRTTLESLSEGILLLDRSGLIQSFNPAAACLLGYDPDEFKGKKVQELDIDIRCRPGEEEGPCRDPLALAAADPEKVDNLIARVSRKGQSQHAWLRVNAKSISGNGAFGLAGVVVSLTDITETKRQADTLQSIFDNFPGGIAHYNESLRLASSNEEFRRLLDFPEELIACEPCLYDFFRYNAKRGDYGPGDPDELALKRYRQYDLKNPQVFERRAANGTYIETRSTPLPSGGMIHIFHDITERKLMEEQLAANERLARHRLEELEAILANMRQGVSVFDQTGRLTLWNKQYIDIFSKPEGEVRKGKSLLELIEAEKARDEFEGDVQEHVMDLLIRLSSGEVVRSKFAHPNGKIILAVHAPMPGGGWIGTHEDITLREQAAAKITHAAHHDNLTGLANRTLFNATLDEALKDAQIGTACSNLLLLDLDRFKPVNDTFGHDVGDELLRQVAQRLKDCVRSTDLVARLGGDEFGIIVRGCDRKSLAMPEIADRIVQKLRAPFTVFAHRIEIGASIGIAPVSERENDAGAIFKKADIALYDVKRSGRNGFRLFEDVQPAKVANG